jgi:hypothetical protein
MRGSDATEWSSQFEKVVRDTIHAHSNGTKAILERARQVFRFWTQDGIYDKLTLETLFKSLYGQEEMLFGWSDQKHLPKIAITSSSLAQKPRTYLFTNYNIDHNSVESPTALDYEHAPRSGSHELQPCLWQM